MLLYGGRHSRSAVDNRARHTICRWITGSRRLSYPHFSVLPLCHRGMRYARRMNGYSEAPHNGEINNYLRKDLDAKATAKNTACWNLLGKVRTKRTLCFSLYTALELCGVELPRHSTLPQKDFYVTVRSKGTRSSLDNVDYRIWNAKFSSIAFSNGVTCMHPMDAWIQFAPISQPH